MRINGKGNNNDEYGIDVSNTSDDVSNNNKPASCS